MPTFHSQMGISTCKEEPDFGATPNLGITADRLSDLIASSQLTHLEIMLTYLSEVRELKAALTKRKPTFPNLINLEITSGDNVLVAE